VIPDAHRRHTLDYGRAVRSVAVAYDARAGIATGAVVVGDIMGDDIAREVNVVGETPNLAARLVGLGNPNEVIVSSSTRRMLGELFTLRHLEPQTLKGFAEKVSAFAVTGERQGLSRFEAIRSSQLSRFVGRTRELALLLNRWARATTGEGQLVLLSGEPGLGKSRLADTRPCSDQRRGNPQGHVELAQLPQQANYDTPNKRGEINAKVPYHFSSWTAAGGVPTAAADGQFATCYAAETVVRRVLQHRSIGLIA
jgi:AAA ATPase domain/Adenylate and Guanylate cyclase catalytic domain